MNNAFVMLYAHRWDECAASAQLALDGSATDEEAAKIQDAILDWRDADKLKRVNGAEEGDYTAAGLGYKPANAPFQAIEELQLVLGMRPDLYRRIAPSITVFSRLPGINPAIASREVLLALPNVTPEMVDEFKKFVISRNTKMDEDAWNKDLDFIRAVIRFEIDQAVFDIATARQHLTTAAALYRVFLRESQARNRLARIQDAAVRAGHGVHVFACDRRCA